MLRQEYQFQDCGMLYIENFQFNNIFDNANAHHDQGYQYTISWKEGVNRMVEWFESHGKWPNSDERPLEDRLIQAWDRLGRDLVTASNQV